MLFAVVVVCMNCFAALVPSQVEPSRSPDTACPTGNKVGLVRPNVSLPHSPSIALACIQAVYAEHGHGLRA